MLSATAQPSGLFFSPKDYGTAGRSKNPLMNLFKRYTHKTITPEPSHESTHSFTASDSEFDNDATLTAYRSTVAQRQLGSPIQHVPTGFVQARYGQAQKLLGSGTGGSVYLHQLDQRRLAVKVFTPAASGARASPEAALQRLNDEASLSLALHHPNVIRTYDYVREADGTFYSVMEHCPNDLFDLVEGNRLTSDDIDHYFVQLVQGVYHMHSVNVAHRDLKLDNVCLTEDGQIKVIDFGCATFFDPLAPAASGVCGSDPYIAPEIFQGQSYDPRKADVWALAVILLSMMSNHFPWEVARSTDPNFRMYLCHRDAMVDHWMVQKPEAAATIKRMLALNPADRPTTAELLADPWLQTVLAHHSADHYPLTALVAAVPIPTASHPSLATTVCTLPPSPSSSVSDCDLPADALKTGIATGYYAHYASAPHHR
ncbi:serine/threonine protein kinase [Dimargaris verticillata]|uniref:Serine/threonine protein kinase n=1 Tax=Dimargaris verticillata TaxID=2761393 RepID=A0A9W8B078_9FUNG|nr:serine/threonine protein kinase [Dimargaris verticillata]